MTKQKRRKTTMKRLQTRSEMSEIPNEINSIESKLTKMMTMQAKRIAEFSQGNQMTCQIVKKNR